MAGVRDPSAPQAAAAGAQTWTGNWTGGQTAGGRLPGAGPSPPTTIRPTDEPAGGALTVPRCPPPPPTPRAARAPRVIQGTAQPPPPPPSGVWPAPGARRPAGRCAAAAEQRPPPGPRRPALHAAEGEGEGTHAHWPGAAARTRTGPGPPRAGTHARTHDARAGPRPQPRSRRPGRRRGRWEAPVGALPGRHVHSPIVKDIPVAGRQPRPSGHFFPLPALRERRALPPLPLHRARLLGPPPPPPPPGPPLAAAASAASVAAAAATCRGCSGPRAPALRPQPGTRRLCRPFGPLPALASPRSGGPLRPPARARGPVLRRRRAGPSPWAAAPPCGGRPNQRAARGRGWWRRAARRPARLAPAPWGRRAASCWSVAWLAAALCCRVLPPGPRSNLVLPAQCRAFTHPASSGPPSPSLQAWLPAALRAPIPPEAWG